VTRDRRAGDGDVDGDVHVGIAYPFDADTLDAFRSVSPRLRLHVVPRYDQSAVDAVMSPEIDGLIGIALPTDRSPMPRLRWLQILSAGAEVALAGRSWPPAVTLTNARGCYATAIAQYTIGAILRISERVDERTELQRRGRWPSDEDRFVGRLVRGRTLLIVGYGGIGREIGRLASAFGMRVLAVKAHPEQRIDSSFRLPGTGDPEGSIPERIVGLDGLADAAADADFVSITLPITAASRGVFGRDVIAALRPDAWIINTGRGAVIDETALLEALRSRRIGGAVLDVFGTEPLPDDAPWWSTPNVIVTPHVAGSSGAAEHRALILENLRRFVEGEPLLNQVDPERGY
jgi:phosphoglycerate dehydrogenase-like enzyme